MGLGITTEAVQSVMVASVIRFEHSESGTGREEADVC